MPDRGGATYRQHLRTAYPDHDRLFEQPPNNLAHVWEYWADLSRTRGSGMTSPQPLTYSEIQAWRELKPSVFLTEWTTELLIRTDCVFRRVWRDWSDKQKPAEDKSN